MFLEQINQPNDIKTIGAENLPILAEEIRTFLIEHLSVTGGHLGSNLGCVELTIALHRVFDLPQDKIIWDVGHQCYTHKILTGRKEGFWKLRQLGGLSGFPDPAESDCDVFTTGHSSTSIALGVGLCKARELAGEDYKVVSVIGDGSLTGGIAYEGINNAALLDGNFIIVLNDNDMSISENVGAVHRQLTRLRTWEGYKELKSSVHQSLDRLPGGRAIASSIHNAKSSLKQLLIPGMVFEQMGLLYLGPVDGHDIQAVEGLLRQAARVKGPVLVHVLTKKGKGYGPAERLPARFHGTSAFDRETGIPLDPREVCYTDVFSTVMRKLGERRPNLVAISAAMPGGTGLSRFKNCFPERFFDVGIAEEAAVLLAAAMEEQGYIPVVAVYSSFLQRAYDEIMIDVCVRKRHVVFAVDRAGLVGSDGITHQGIFDLAYLCSMPNMVVMAPKNKWELSDMLKFAAKYDGPVAIRYPKGKVTDRWKEHRSPIRLGECEVLRGEFLEAGPSASAGVSASGGSSALGGVSALGGPSVLGGAFALAGASASGGSSASGGASALGGSSASAGESASSGPSASSGRILLFALGSQVLEAEQVYERLIAEGYKAVLVSARFAAPLDIGFLWEHMGKFDLVVTMEEGIRSGGFGERVAAFLAQEGFDGRVLVSAIEDRFVPHGSVAEQKKMTGIDAESVTEKILAIMGRGLQ